VLDESLLRGLTDVPLEAAQRHVVAGLLLQPLKVVFEVVADVLLDVELVDGETVDDVECGLREFGAHVGILVLVVLLANGVVGVLHDLYDAWGTKRYEFLMVWKPVFL